MAPLKRSNRTHDIRRLRYLWLAIALTAAASPLRAQSFETKATEALLVDAGTGTVLFSKNPDQLFPPASLAKLMTMEVVFHLLQAGRASTTDVFEVSENAWRKGGAPSGTSTMFAKLKSKVALGDLVQGVVVQVANDACIVIAEGIAGDEQKFAAMMTDRAREIGLTASTFNNATGLPAPGQQVNARDLVTLAIHLAKDYPQFYGLYSQPDFTWNNITQRNRNPLLAMNLGVDGLASGFAEASGYAIVAASQRDGRRTILVLGGLPSDAERTQEARRVLAWGAAAFRKSDLFAPGVVVGKAKVFGGAEPDVDLTANGPVSVFLPVKDQHPVTARIVYDGPIPAPIMKGAPLATLQVLLGDTVSQTTPLFAARSVGVGAIHQRAIDAVTELLTGWLRKAPAS